METTWWASNSMDKQEHYTQNISSPLQTFTTIRQTRLGRGRFSTGDLLLVCPQMLWIADLWKRTTNSSRELERSSKTWNGFPFQVPLNVGEFGMHLLYLSEYKQFSPTVHQSFSPLALLAENMDGQSFTVKMRWLTGFTTLSFVLMEGGKYLPCSWGRRETVPQSAGHFNIEYHGIRQPQHGLLFIVWYFLCVDVLACYPPSPTRMEL